MLNKTFKALVISSSMSIFFFQQSLYQNTAKLKASVVEEQLHNLECFLLPWDARQHFNFKFYFYFYEKQLLKQMIVTWGS